MRIEDITPETLRDKTQVPGRELFNLRHRFVQIYKNNFEGNAEEKSDDFERADFIAKYKVLRAEMWRRGFRSSVTTGLDIAIFKSAMKWINVQNLGRIPIVKNYLSIGGEFLEAPKTAEQIEVTIQDIPDSQCEELLKTVGELIKSETGKQAIFNYEPEGPTAEHIPIFDLVLQSREKTEKAQIEKEKIPINKPEVTETQIRIPVGKPCDITATMTIDASQGIQALYCGKEKRIRTYLFDKKKWTISTARAWIKEHKTKANEDNTRLEKAEFGKKLTPSQRKECDAETAKIKENEKTVKFPHEFKAAKFTHPNGHPRCLACGDEEPIGKVCGMPKKWYSKHAWDDDEAWEEERKKINYSKAKERPFFKFVKIDKKQQIVGGVIYAPEEVDSQGDFTDSTEIQKAMYKFMESYAKNTSRIKIMHKGRTYDFPILESFQPEEDTRKGNETIKAGAWWLMIKVRSKAIWDQIERGELNGFSMGGQARA